MTKVLSDEEIEMLADKYRKIKTSSCKIFKKKFKTLEDFVFKSCLWHELEKPHKN